VLTLPELVEHDGFRVLDMAQEVTRPSGTGADPVVVHTVRTPVRYDGRVLKHDRAAPRLGEHTEAIRAEFAARAEQVEVAP
jgi:crotonobetainyl-CoA:carnitine CoA-transferase CaiB-like acyl-CoA transferase